MPAWSYSALSSFETCPRRHYHLRVAKDVIEPESQALTWGNAVHKSLEARVVNDTPLPTGMTQWEPLVAKLIAAPCDERFTERQIALDRAFQPVEWFGREVWVRGVVDIGLRQGNTLLALDYKTGKTKDDFDQLRLFAALLFALYPEAETVKAGYVWLQANKVTKQTFSREDTVSIWNDFLPRVARLEQAHKDKRWPVKPSGLCRAWCPCTGCEHNGRRT
jgi:hypothetical protein